MLNCKIIDCHEPTNSVINEALKYNKVAIRPDYRIQKYKLEAQQDFKEAMKKYGYECKIERDGVNIYYVMEKAN